MSAVELAGRLAAWLVASGFVLLLAYLAHRPLRSSSPALNAAVYLLLALLLTSLVVLLAGLTGLLRPFPITIASLAGLAFMSAVPRSRAAARQALTELRAFSDSCRGLWREFPRWLQWLTAVGIGLSLVRFAFLVWALPPFVWDSLTYHLTNVAHWTQTGRIELFDTPVDRIYSPANYELLATWFTVFLHHDVVVEAAGIPAYVLSLISVYCIGRSLGAAPPAAWMGMLAFATTPALLIAVTGTKNDPLMSGYFLLALALVLNLSNDPPQGRTINSLGTLIAIALALLLAAGTKAYIAHLLPGLALVIILHRPRLGGLTRLRDHLATAVLQVRRLPSATRTGLAALLCAGLLLGGYWNVRNWILTGNPFFPYGVAIEGASLIEGPKGYYHLGLDRLVDNLGTLLSKFGDKDSPIRPDLPGTTGWGWFVHGIGIPTALWGVLRSRRLRVLAAGFLLSFLTVMLSTRPSPWNMRYVIWFPAWFCLAFAVFWDRLPTGMGLVRRGLNGLFVISLGLNFVMTLNYNKISAEEFRSMLALPVWQRDAARFTDNMPTPYRNAVEFVPADSLLGYNVHGNGFIYPLYRADFAQRITHVPFTPEDSCETIAGRMQERGTRYLLVAPEHSDDRNIARLRQCAEAGTVIRERARGLYVLR